ncbi:MAG: aminopeptidase P family N-terminal domain-containing protein, partial [Bacillota bacterium]
MENSNRIKNIHSRMDEIGIDGLLIDSPENRYYLSGFTGSAGRILFTVQKDYFLTDFRYIEQVSEQTEGFEVREINKNFEIQLNELLQETGVKKLGIES